MSSTIVRRSVVAGLGAAVGALVAAALMTTAPIASAVPDDFTNDFSIFLGGTEDTFYTTWDGTGLPVTIETTTPESTGTEAFGFEDGSGGDFTLGTTSFETDFQTVLVGLFSATGNDFDFVPPLLEISTF
jgi:hypothetical protein